MGITEQSLAAEKLLTPEQKSDLKYLLHQHGFNAIFEYISPDNQIVVPYEKSELILLAVRRIFDGVYFNWNKANQFKLVPTHSFTMNDQNIADIRKNTTGIEGYVVKWEDGTYVKIKGEEYTQMHRAVSYFERENMILPIILDMQCDDLYPNLSQERVERLQKYEAHVLQQFNEYVNLVRYVAMTHPSDESRKDFALKVNSGKYPKELSSAFFRVLDGGDAGEAVKACILRNPESLIKERW